MATSASELAQSQSDYERRRLERIAANQSKMQALGLFEAKTAVQELASAAAKDPASTKAPRKKRTREEASGSGGEPDALPAREPSRRSSARRASTAIKQVIAQENVGLTFSRKRIVPIREGEYIRRIGRFLSEV